MEDKKIPAAQIPPAATDGGQPIACSCNHSITENQEEYNSQMEQLHQIRAHYDPNRLFAMSMYELFEHSYQTRPAIVEGLIYPGTHILAGAPKVGKSFLVAQIAYAVSTGASLWGYDVRQGSVLYLALEDDYVRLRERLYRMFDVECTEHLYLAIGAKQVGHGLVGQLDCFLHEHPDTTLIIIDTVQRVREAEVCGTSYASDYEFIREMKEFADRTGVCIMMVHHTRKRHSEDPFETVSGTFGLVGAADSIFVLHRESAETNEVALSIRGRDQAEQTLYLTHNPDRLIWELVRVDSEPWKNPPDPLLESVAEMLQNSDVWVGSPTELVKTLNLELQPNKLTMRLNVLSGRLATDYGIGFEASRTHDGRRIKLFRIEQNK